MAGEKIVRLLQQVSKEAASSPRTTDLVYGKVVTINPLAIQVASRYNITKDFLLLSSLCTEKWIGEGVNKQMLWRGLQVGDSVRMLRVQGGQLFYVLEREGGLTIG